NFCPNPRPVRDLADALHLKPTVAVALIVVEKVVARLAGDVQIEEPVVIVISPRTCREGILVLGRAAPLDSVQISVSVIVIKEVDNIGVNVRRAVIREEEIEKTVVVIVAPRAPIGSHV